MRAIAANAVTIVRVPLGAAALLASLDGRLTAAATLITVCAVLDGVDGKVARWLAATSPFGALFDYFCDYLCFIVAPWALTRAVVGANGGAADAILIVPLVTGAARYARSGVIVTSRNEEVQDLPGLATMFFAFVGVVAVFALSVGAAAGVGIDALFGPKTIYRRDARRSTVALAPIYDRHRRGVAASIRF